ncbi:porin family protein [Neptunitalea lumnitzerae]|uniref:Outer membrane protein beta-barrel domain-containing protein n=1 Tax=Neptunitalea lumnitzerae TaxID=2965509 RepID=A0ABQ5MEF3_9FLAO|nr:hypothetical protein [Neptunitalea sp. Y10]GLB47761.1 hypothetical protein Y10_01290 [Neptunitalea sp. Y10]
MKKLLALLVLLTTLPVCAQIEFEKGYYITETNDKVTGYIKNLDWRFNPESFVFSSTLNGEEKELSINTVKEFGIDGISKYVKYSGTIDMSTRTIQNMDHNSQPVLVDRTVFLKVLTEGEATLYYFLDKNAESFFFSKGSGAIEELVFKEYVDDSQNLRQNNAFRNQLYRNLKSSQITLKKIKGTDYKKKELIEIFELYNNSNEATEKGKKKTSYKKKNSSEFTFLLNVRPGAMYSSFSTEREGQNSLPEVDFESKIGPRLGVELEFVLPFNKNKWSIIVEPTYQFYKDEQTITYYGSSTMVTEYEMELDYASIELPVGIRYYSFLSDKTQLFYNAVFTVDLALKNELTYGGGFNYANGDSLNTSTGTNVGLGVGVRFNNRHSLEINYKGGRELLGEFPSLNGKFSSISLIYGYNIFSSSRK